MNGSEKKAKKTDTIVAALDMSFVREELFNKWVALSPDRKTLLVVGDSLAEVLEKTGQQDVAIMQVLPDLGYVA